MASQTTAHIAKRLASFEKRKAFREMPENIRQEIKNESHWIADCGCWFWLKSQDNKGYGSLHRLKECKAHRVSYRVFKATIPAGMHVLHHCDTKCCVNPDHLWLGTNADNVADKVQKGRQARMIGEEHPCHKLTEADIPEIFKKFAHGFSQTEIARQFGVDRTQIGHILRREHWKHIHT